MRCHFTLVCNLEEGHQGEHYLGPLNSDEISHGLEFCPLCGGERHAKCPNVKPGANADLIAEARSFPCRHDDAPCQQICADEAANLLDKLADALEAADSRVLPTREQILDRVRQVVRDEEGEEDGDSIAFCERVTDAVLALLTGGKADE